MLQLVLLGIAFVSLSGIMAMIEAAVLGVTRAEVEEMAENGLRGARILRLLKDRITHVVVVVVVLTNTINVLGPVLVGTRAVETYGSAVIGIITMVLTAGTIVFSEIIPKSLGTHYAPRISLAVAPALRVLILAVYPLVWLFERLIRIMQVGERRVGTEQQIRSLVRLGHSAGYIGTDETRLVHRVFQLNDRTAAELMTPIDRVLVLCADATVAQAAALAIDSPYTRFPVLDQGGAVAGVIISHDVLRALSENRDDDPVVSLIRDPLLVSDTTRADDLLLLFRNQRFHLAVVRSDGRPVGVVTLEDVLEELDGEITDEREADRLDQRPSSAEGDSSPTE